MSDTATPSLKKRNRLSDIVKLVIFLGIGFFFIYWFLLKLDSSQKEAIWTSFTHADYFWVGVTMVCCLLSHFVRALRWQLLFGPLGCRPGLGNTFGSVVVAYMANLAFPRLGEVMRCATLRTSDDIPMEKSLGTVVTERFVDVLAFGIVVLLGILCMYGQAQEWIYNTLSEKSHSLPHIAVIVVALLVAAVASVFFYRYFRERLLKYPLFQKIDGIIQKHVFNQGTDFIVPDGLDQGLLLLRGHVGKNIRRDIFGKHTETQEQLLLVQ